MFDQLLDRTVVLSYTNLGYLLRRPTWSNADPDEEALTGKRVVVTGAGSGLGEAAALELARLGATVHLLGRSVERVGPALERIEARLTAEGRPVMLEAEACDVSDPDDVRRFAAAFTAEHSSLDVLVHNAGTLPAERQESVDGHELTLATHVLGPILMTELLRPVLAEGARVVFVSSGGMYSQRLPVHDLEYREEPYRGAVAYARSKRVQVELTPYLVERWPGLAVHTMHPGWADTPGVASSLPLFRTVTRPFLRTPRQGADTIVWLAATAPAPPSGLFWHDRAPRPIDYVRRTRSTESERNRVWALVRGAIGLEVTTP